MRRYWYLAIAAVIAGALGALPLTAFAASGILTVGSTGGSAVAHNDVLTGTLSGNAVFTNTANSGQKVTCTSSTIQATDDTNPVPTGTATLNTSSQTFGGCSISGVFGASNPTVTTNASAGCPWATSIDDTTNPAIATITKSSVAGCSDILATVHLTVFGFGITCTYSPNNGTIKASAPLGSSSGLTFPPSGTTDTFSKVSGPGTCFGSANFTGVYTFTDDNQGGGAVFVN